MSTTPPTTPSTIGKIGVLADDGDDDEPSLGESAESPAEEVGSVERDVCAPNASAKVGFDQLGVVKLEL